MAIVSLEALGLTGDIPKCSSLTYHREVPDVGAALIEIMEQDAHRRGVPVPPVQRQTAKLFSQAGMYIEAMQNEQQAAHIVLGEKIHPLAQAYVQGHEETHVTQVLGGGERLANIFRQSEWDFSLPPQCSKDFAMEFGADLGGIYAAVRSGVSLSDLRSAVDAFFDDAPVLAPNRRTIFYEALSRFNDGVAEQRPHRQQ